MRTKTIAAAEAIYRITDIPSFDPALKFSLRKQATEILGSMTGIVLFTGVRRIAERERVAALVASTRELIRFAESLRLIAPENAERIIGAYERADEHLGTIAAEHPFETPVVPEAMGGNPVAFPDASGEQPQPPLAIMNDRQVKIVAYLADNGRAQIGDIRQVFGDAYSEKTLQRDLWQLVESGRVKRQGDNRWTVYLPR
ncbi:MAG: DeoR family transcriptional regulator [bacterium]|nr:DeoR family transcriptional regulator [bacterium]